MSVSTGPGLFEKMDGSARPLDQIIVGLEDLAELFGVSEPTIMRWARDEDLPRQAHGRYRLTDCVRWYAARHSNSGPAADGDLQDERRKLIVSQRQHQDLENAKMREELIDVNVVSTAFQEVGALIATQLDALAPRMAPQLVQLRDQGAIQRLLYDECRAIRANASRSVARWSADFMAGEQPAPPTRRKGRAPSRRQPRKEAQDDA
jgi:phage terminase Nu1 subunit (DNA packaging protein)